MARTLEELQQLLAQGRVLSGQSSYERQAPASRAKPHLFEAQTELRKYTDDHPEDEAGWRLRAQAEECVTNYLAAIRCLERAMELSGRRDRKDLKALIRLRECAADNHTKTAQTESPR
jgi:predicted Zn-dependent protease